MYHLSGIVHWLNVKYFELMASCTAVTICILCCYVCVMFSDVFGEAEFNPNKPGH